MLDVVAALVVCKGSEGELKALRSDARGRTVSKDAPNHRARVGHALELAVEARQAVSPLLHRRTTSLDPNPTQKARGTNQACPVELANVKVLVLPNHEPSILGQKPVGSGVEVIRPASPRQLALLPLFARDSHEVHLVNLERSRRQCAVRVD